MGSSDRSIPEHASQARAIKSCGPEFVPLNMNTMRSWFICIGLTLMILLALVGRSHPGVLWGFLIVLPLFVLGVYDMLQQRHTILRNFPVLGHFRYMFEFISPELQQYFIERNTDGHPFSRQE